MNAARVRSILLLAGASGLAGMAVRSCAVERAREHWPTVRGRMDSAQVKYAGKDGGRRARRIYFPDLRYSYVVGADTFHGGRLNWEEPDDRSRAELERRLRRFPVGDSIDVHYDPAHPASAVLETGGNNSGLLFWLGVFFLLAGAVVQDAKARS